MCALWLFCIHLKAERQQENYYQGRKIVAQLVICVFFRGSEYLKPNTSDLLWLIDHFWPNISINLKIILKKYVRLLPSLKVHAVAKQNIAWYPRSNESIFQ